MNKVFFKLDYARPSIRRSHAAFGWSDAILLFFIAVVVPATMIAGAILHLRMFL